MQRDALHSATSLVCEEQKLHSLTMHDENILPTFLLSLDFTSTSKSRRSGVRLNPLLSLL